MKTYTFQLIVAALLATQLISCKTAQTYSYNNAPKPLHPGGMDQYNTTNSKLSKAQQKYQDYQNYVEGLKKSYGINTVQDNVSESSNIAAAPYILLTGGK